MFPISAAQTMGWHRYTLSGVPDTFSAAVAAMGLADANFTAYPVTAAHTFRLPFTLFDVPFPAVAMDRLGGLHFNPQDRCCPASLTTPPYACTLQCLTATATPRRVLPGTLPASIVPFSIDGFTLSIASGANVSRSFYHSEEDGILIVRMRARLVSDTTAAASAALYAVDIALQSPDAVYVALSLADVSPATPAVLSELSSLSSVRVLSAAVAPALLTAKLLDDGSGWPSVTTPSETLDEWPGFVTNSFAATRVTDLFPSDALAAGKTVVYAAVAVAGSACLAPVPARVNNVATLTLPTYTPALRAAGFRGPIAEPLAAPSAYAAQLTCVADNDWASRPIADRLASFAPEASTGRAAAPDPTAIAPAAARAAGTVFTCPTGAANAAATLQFSLALPDGVVAGSDRLYPTLLTRFSHSPAGTAPGTATVAVTAAATPVVVPPPAATAAVCVGAVRAPGVAVAAAADTGASSGSGAAALAAASTIDCAGTLGGGSVLDSCGACVPDPDSAPGPDCHGQCYGPGPGTEPDVTPIGPCPVPGTVYRKTVAISSTLNELLPFKILAVSIIGAVLALALITLACIKWECAPGIDAAAASDGDGGSRRKRCCVAGGRVFGLLFPLPPVTAQPPARSAAAAVSAIAAASAAVDPPPAAPAPVPVAVPGPSQQSLRQRSFNLHREQASRVHLQSQQQAQLAAQQQQQQQQQQQAQQQATQMSRGQAQAQSQAQAREQARLQAIEAYNQQERERAARLLQHMQGAQARGERRAPQPVGQRPQSPR
jgi:hypothetical protein